MTTEREFVVTFKVKSPYPWKRYIPNYPNSGHHHEIHASDGVWYRVPIDATIRDISPLQEGYYLIEGHRSVYRYLIAAPQNVVELYNGTKWVASELFSDDNMAEWRDKTQYLGPLDPDDATL